MRYYTEYLLELCSTLSLPNPSVSFEFFPPKTEDMEQKLWQVIQQLGTLNPRFISVTYGAGGSTRERTHATLQRIIEQTSLKPAAHLTCIGTTRDEITTIAQNYWEVGVRHIVALRGDPPEGTTHYLPHPNGFAYASELVTGLKKIADFEISVAAYPEGHPETANKAQDLAFLKQKIDAGATRAITQFFFDTELYLRFIEKVHKIGIHVPIVPGILPVTNFKQLIHFASKCGTSIPAWMSDLFEGLDNDPSTRNLIAAIVAVEQCRRLSRAGIHEFHFYTLNRAELTLAICHILGIRQSNISFS